MQRCVQLFHRNRGVHILTKNASPLCSGSYKELETQVGMIVARYDKREVELRENLRRTHEALERERDEAIGQLEHVIATKDSQLAQFAEEM